MSELQETVDTIVENAKEKLADGGYTGTLEAVEEAAREELHEPGEDYPVRLSELLVGHALEEFGGGWHGELEYRFREGEALLVLDADDCPTCGCGIINISFEQQAQFVEAGAGTRNAFPEDPERTMYRPDDGPHTPELTFARCSCCQEVLHDPDSDE